MSKHCLTYLLRGEVRRQLVLLEPHNLRLLGGEVPRAPGPDAPPDAEALRAAAREEADARHDGLGLLGRGREQLAPVGRGADLVGVGVGIRLSGAGSQGRAH